MKDIVFFDIDGTLLDHHKNIPDSTKKAIKELKSNGVYVAIATGRTPFMFEHIRKELEIDSYVSFNGQFVVFENELIYKNPLLIEAEKALTELANKNGHPLVYLTEKTMKANVEYHPHIEEGIASLKFPHPAYDPSFYLHNEIYQALLFCEEKDEDIYIGKFPDLHFVRWHQYSMDVLPNGGSKAEGIKQMISKLGIHMKNVYAFGDGLNDVEMIKEVGTGVAMGNAVDILKGCASFVTEDVDNGGIYYGLKKLELI
ncbi:Cof-type HAD-IIB family hydrolase [Heyndrickxia ginsengihumi]|uniref:Cof-type HAD-IIB family hydrolase n=1 Tax=Heyndrickxia ginsengihumi TaxID=363870 RepID=A0A0A6VBY9_9BACI|nr:Cof-type HAD-IIB family hydrolase [Heyndrickxia ginsengihumi]KHD84064.1 hypothetical protein NG54_17965 [Heyndrickxia ginsengihumi]MBE6183647.1 Cof-type HAD-IIB family hydrolase [Bacillus sp. (in: firmicutes)]MCM3022357.1 Cof-type HAD-IIB family hydrolase [Heyndrickxia ginsengihumi]